MEDPALIHENQGAKSTDENLHLLPGSHRRLFTLQSLGVVLSGLPESSWKAVLVGQEAPRSLLA